MGRMLDPRLRRHPSRQASRPEGHGSRRSRSARATPSGDSDPGPYAAKLAGKFRDKPDIYVMPSGGRCVVTGAAKDHLSCVTDGFFVGKFELEPAAKNMKIVLQGSDEHIALVPGVDTASFVLLSPDNPEHSLFVLNPAPAKSCAVGPSA